MFVIGFMHVSRIKAPWMMGVVFIRMPAEKIINTSNMISHVLQLYIQVFRMFCILQYLLPP